MAFARVVLWTVAGGLAGYFGSSHARAWRSLAVGFVLLSVSELLGVTVSLLSGLLPEVLLVAGPVIGIVAVLVISHSLQEYHSFTQTLDEREGWVPFGWGMAGGGGLLLLLLLAGPEPTATVRRGLNIVANSNWVFLTLVNIGVICKVCSKLRGTPINKGLVLLAWVFAGIVLWKGCELYLDVYHLEVVSTPYRALSLFGLVGGVVSSIGVSATFAYFARLLR